ncbi:MAG: hypothetical protein IJC56_09030 [Clostridia bacterium]|nr:hypothetical protein [Clostridia bacterium]
MNFRDVMGCFDNFRDLNYRAMVDGMSKLADAALQYGYDELMAAALADIDENRTMYGCRTKLTLGYGYYLPLINYRQADNCCCGDILTKASRRQYVYKYDSADRVRLILAQDRSTAVICSYDGNSAVYYLFNVADGVGTLRDVAALEYDENGYISQMILASNVDFFIETECKHIHMFYEKYREIGTYVREVTAYELINVDSELYIFRDCMELIYENGEIIDCNLIGVSNERVTSID